MAKASAAGSELVEPEVPEPLEDRLLFDSYGPLLFWVPACRDTAHLQAAVLGNAGAITLIAAPQVIAVLPGCMSSDELDDLIPAEMPRLPAGHLEDCISAKELLPYPGVIPRRPEQQLPPIRSAMCRLPKQPAAAAAAPASPQPAASGEAPAEAAAVTPPRTPDADSEAAVAADDEEVFNRKRKAFTHADRERMVRFVEENRTLRPKGEAIWRLAARLGITCHTASSMQNHWKKHLCSRAWVEQRLAGLPLAGSAAARAAAGADAGASGVGAGASASASHHRARVPPAAAAFSLRAEDSLVEASELPAGSLLKRHRRSAAAAVPEAAAAPPKKVKSKAAAVAKKAAGKAAGKAAAVAREKKPATGAAVPKTGAAALPAAAKKAPKKKPAAATMMPAKSSAPKVLPKAKAASSRSGALPKKKLKSK
eukprot:TRINITY_DN10980_c0_g1_i1.p2 TRINITY_DN10980_c0_g1~~TRINITY_DN10980_c0_g1_i1.p2  ORF type:complete len:425 (+),score=142.17 TRINITY_DN10980_c0_g1_i1:138-1412(+)